MTVKELIVFLKKQPQDLSVAYCLHSEYCLLNIDNIDTRELGVARNDGWVHEKRPDKPTQTYLVFPGN